MTIRPTRATRPARPVDQRTRRRAHISRLEQKQEPLTRSERALLAGLRRFEDADPTPDLDAESRTDDGSRR